MKITLNPATSASMQAGSVLLLSASAQNGAGANLNATFVYIVAPFVNSAGGTATVDVTPNGVVCAGTWNAPLYTVCTPGNYGVAQVTATALGATSPVTLIFVHPSIDTISISAVQPITPPPPACPNQTELPTACEVPFKPSGCSVNSSGVYTCGCLSQNQTVTLQATALDSNGNDITPLVGPFTWSAGATTVNKITPIITNNDYNVPTNQVTVAPATPGQTQVIAAASGAFSQPYDFESCPVQCIALQLSENGVPLSQTSFSVNKGTSETILATAVDVQGCIVPKPALTWVSSNPAAITVPTSCSANTTCTVSTAQPGSATVTANCTPPTCNVGFPLNLSAAAFPPPYAPEPVYPVTSISGIATGATSSTTVLATSQDCYSNEQCQVGIYNVSTTTNVPGSATPFPTPPNSVLFDLAGDRAYVGSEFGAATLNPGNLGTASPAFAPMLAPGTPLGLVTGKIIGISTNGNLAVFSDTVSTPNQVYVVNAAPSTTTPLNINSAIAATFSPDGMKAYILGDGGNSLYVYSALQPLQAPIALAAPASSVVFNSTGTYALLSGGSATSPFAAYNTCDNAPITIPAGTVTTPPQFLKMVPWSTIPPGGVYGDITIPTLSTTGLDFFLGLDSTGVDVIATNATQPALTALCDQAVATPAAFPPAHINLNHGTMHPIAFFVSPDSTRAYIVTTDSNQVLIYDFLTNAVAGMPLINNAIPVTASMSVDGSLIYVAGSDGLLHQLNTSTQIDEYQATFVPLPNSSNSFCYTGTDCALNVIAVKP
ncbi:MAG TPA: hypothetical protein VND65_22350 [Candidatus Binatia bacterium]|nr:hypothetical protein [Candidatus Binatia bacterium]